MMLRRSLLLLLIALQARSWAPSLEPPGLPAVLRASRAEINRTSFIYAAAPCGAAPPPAAGFQPAGALLAGGIDRLDFAVLHWLPRLNVSAAGGDLVLLLDISMSQVGGGFFVALHNDSNRTDARGARGDCLGYTTVPQELIYECSGCGARIERSTAVAFANTLGSLRLGVDGVFVTGDPDMKFLNLLERMTPTVLTLRIAFTERGARIAAALYDSSGALLPAKAVDQPLPRPLEEVTGGQLARLAIGASYGSWMGTFNLVAVAAFSNAAPSASDVSASPAPPPPPPPPPAPLPPSCSPSALPGIPPSRAGGIEAPLFGAGALLAAAALLLLARRRQLLLAAAGGAARDGREAGSCLSVFSAAAARKAHRAEATPLNAGLELLEMDPA